MGEVPLYVTAVLGSVGSRQGLSCQKSATAEGSSVSQGATLYVAQLLQSDRGTASTERSLLLPTRPPCIPSRDSLVRLQGYLAHKKPNPPRTLQ